MLSLPRNIWILALTFSFAMSGIAMLLFIGGIIGTALAPDESLASLPLATFVVGTALSTIPAAILMRKFGRKIGSFVGLIISLSSAGLCFFALEIKSFTTFILGCALIGSGTAFYQQFRFAAMESVENARDIGPALSLLMLFSIVGAVIGPELGAIGKHLLPNHAEYTGAFVLFALMILCAMMIFSFFKTPATKNENESNAPRALQLIIFQPVFIIALLASAIGYAVMSFLMTSTPISMHSMQNHSLHEAKWVIQSHLIAMFLPSLFSGFLVKHFGAIKILLCGCALYLCVICIGLSGQELGHYWWALVLLGIGWNFLFLSGTSLLPHAYEASERFQAQAVNDFSVFALQAAASLSAAWILFRFGWNTQLWICLPLTLALALLALSQWKTLKEL